MSVGPCLIVYAFMLMLYVFERDIVSVCMFFRCIRLCLPCLFVYVWFGLRHICLMPYICFDALCMV